MTAPNDKEDKMFDEFSKFVNKWSQILDSYQVLRLLCSGIGTFTCLVSQRTGNDCTRLGTRVAAKVMQVVADEMDDEDARTAMN